MKPYSPEACAQSDSLAQAWLTPSPTHAPPRLPTSATELIGRERDLQALGELLHQKRLITLVGPGGVGKSRLAQQLAWNSLSDYRDGVFWISLAGIHDLEYLIPTLAEALGLTFFRESEPRAHIIDYLTDRQVLLIIDNFEYVLTAAPFLAEIVDRTTAVTLLVTSRERLNLYEEWVYEVQGLSIPAEGISSTENSQEQGAIALFLQRAHQLGVNLPLSDVTLPHLMRLCRLVAGLPLALELAAVWVRAMSVQDIVHEIERNLDFLAQGWYNLPPHQRGLRMVFEHSWQRLTTEEQRVCSSLALFQGRIQRAAALQVAEATPIVLASLVDKSFLRWETAQEYYVLHPVLRQYAAEKLTERPSAAERIRDRHCAYFARFLHEREAALQGHGQSQALHEIAGEIDNIRQAWEWAVQHGLERPLEDSLTGLFRYYTYRGQLHEGLAAFTRAAECWQGGANALQASLPKVVWQLLARQAMFEFRLGQYPRSKERLRACVDTFRKLGNWEEASHCLDTLGYLSVYQGAYGTAQTLFEESLSLAQGVQLSELTASGLAGLGTVHLYQYHPVEAEAFYKQALCIYQQLGELRGEGEMLSSLSIIFREWGDYDRARTCCERALWIDSQIGNRLDEARVLINIGIIYQLQGIYEEAEKYYQKSLTISYETGYRRCRGLAQLSLGVICQLLGDFHNAQDLFLQALNLFEAIGFRLGISEALYHLGLIACDMGDVGTARGYARQLLIIAQADGNRFSQIYALKIMGHAQVEMQHPQETLSAFQQAIGIGRELNQTSQVLPLLADLANVYQTQGDLAQAQVQVEEILKYQGTKTLEESENDPCQIYLACYRVLKAGPDPRAFTVLQTAHQILQDRAARLSDEQRRHSYLENIAAHREILAEMAALATPADISPNEPQTGALVEPLTPRELDVLRLMAKGLSNNEIAERLVLGRATIKSHAHRLFAKLEVHNRAQAIQRARELKLL